MSTTGALLILLTAALTMVANLLLRAGVDNAGGFVFDGGLALVRALLRLFMQPLFMSGFIAYMLASIVWFRVVATEPLSIAYPVLVSLTFILVTGGAVAWFGEPWSVRKIVGLLVILGGIAVIAIEKG